MEARVYGMMKGERPGFWLWFAWQVEKVPTPLWLTVIALETLAIYLQYLVKA